MNQLCLFRAQSLRHLFLAVAAVFLFGSLPASFAWGQATNLTGAIQGTITDPGGALVPNATVTITNLDTNVSKAVTTDGAGSYASGPLISGNYQVTIEAAGFAQIKATMVVQIGLVTNGSYKLKVGGSSQVVEVSASAIQVDQSQTTVSSVITPEQIKNLPVQGRNFLDLAQLEPGVQLQSGETFDPTKAGYSALSIGGVSGRTTRILLDGSDITDETVGTTIFNVPSGAVGEFQLTRSTGDASSAITSSGSVNVSTPSGTNSYHGQLFYNFQDNVAGFANAPNGLDAPFQRNQFGGNIGGPILKDKLFIFGDSERIKQESAQVVSLASTFSALNSQFPTYPSPFRDTYSTIRLDYNGPWGVHYFARGNYEVNSVASTFGYGYSLYANRDNTPGIAYGADFVTGHFTHSFRGGYEKFHNLISDLTGADSGLYNPFPNIELHIPSSGLYTGPNLLAPQQTYQSEKQFRYDGSWTKGAHILRYGAGFNRILGGGFASFFGIAPEVVTGTSPIAGGDPSNPLDYSAAQVTLGNGQGYYTETPEFGAPAGGQGDWRLDMYIADSWKVTPTFTLNYGVLYQRDTGRSDSDLAPLPCSEITVSPAPCSGNQSILDQFGAGLGDRINQPNGDFGPQLGLAYAPSALNGNTVFRAGIGMYYENFVFNNVLFDRPFKLQQGLFSAQELICGGTNSFTMPTGETVDSYNGVPISQLCSEPVGQAADAFAGLQAEYQKSAVTAGAQANPNFVGTTLAIPAGADYDAYAPHQFTTPRSLHVNFGIQQKLFNGGVLTVDFLHQVDWKFEEAVDVNRVGAAQYFDPTAAQGAINAVLSACNASNVQQAIDSCPADASGHATIFDFANPGNLYPNGYSGPAMDSGVALTGGYPNAGNIAFPGKNPNVGQGQFQFPSGKSAYDALQIQFRGQKTNPFPGFTLGNLEVSYNYSRFVTNVGAAGANVNAPTSDQYFTPGVWDYNNPTRYIGRGSLDRPQQISFGGFITPVQPSFMRKFSTGPTIGIIAHFYSAPPSSLVLDATSGDSAQIFQTDWTGDGQTGDIVPETDPGTYMRATKPGSLNKVINQFNARYANQLTPAGQTVVNSGLITAQQMQQLGGVMQPMAPASNSAVPNGDFKEMDASFAYPIKLRFISEGASIEPTVAFYNVANFGNYGPLNSGGSATLLNTSDVGAAGLYPNSPNSFLNLQQLRTSRGSGTFNEGGPRSAEFQLKFNF
ncbi:TonB-dependent receptor [Paracidobacterium acidisoli]|uniref:TonB-dependent receptor n=1 Tax=Paracidobacterium acidisoli TaxID=2303751 RepID=A0A372IQ18_9BACT|nr:carboxypeptidase regulatory-like domain-containing protein [Paracidobacterium acidisoli]MBT9330929.1 carboxypeptidase regulatory-like domain-containing protein [Paracidobacterium acidisoli]